MWLLVVQITRYYQIPTHTYMRIIASESRQVSKHSEFSPCFNTTQRGTKYQKTTKFIFVCFERVLVNDNILLVPV